MTRVTYDQIMQTAMGFWASKTLFSAVELGVFSALATTPMAAEELRSHLGIHDRAARDFFDSLVALRFLDRDDAGVYRNSPQAARFLDPAQPGYVGSLLEMFNARLYGFWGALAEALRTGEPQNEASHGGDLFANLCADPKRLEGFMRAMTGGTAPVAEALAGVFPWADVQSVVDVGCAQGCVPVRLALAHPHLAAAGFDLPVVEPIFSRYVAEHDLSKRVRFIVGDFFQVDLPRADILIMGMILHDWDLGDYVSCKD